jgi:flagellin-like hook-associated protein FlgL
MSILATIAGMAPDQARLRSRIDVLTRQVSTGQVGQVHGDLGPQARRAIDLRGDIARREAHLVATDSALGRMAVAQETLGRLETLANDVATAAQRARTLGTIALEPLARSARAALEEAAALMNMRHGGDPLFAGSHLTRDPVPDAASIATGPMAAAIGAAVATLGASNAGAVLAATAAAATDPATTPFDPWLETDGIAEQRRALLVADGERVAWGVLPNENQDGDVTLAWGRELLRGFATLAALTPTALAQGPEYDALLRGVSDGLAGASRALAVERGALGLAEQRVEAARDRHKDLLVLIRAQLGAVEEVDLAAVTAALRQTEMRLSASYETTAMVARLSLAALLR